MSTSPFCGFGGKLTAEHVFGAWLSRSGLGLEPVAHGAGPLNRISPELGVRPPFRQTVRVCGECNNGWMSRLEVVGQRVLTPIILGEPAEILAADAGAVAVYAEVGPYQAPTGFPASPVASPMKTAAWLIGRSAARYSWMTGPHHDEADRAVSFSVVSGRGHHTGRIVDDLAAPITGRSAPTSTASR
jgi:hypothetical protein